ncbi:sll1532 [Synechocystis sp. PCC 6803]|uniref:Sll1532 protein n=1 Tax=Synechocystis sp. (strain ATCC 27184 / PCC 6803 / Kazusa) TaxID=1111708 RepID=P74351_SYNY3|nr:MULTISPECIES: hypothetical protein [unclassified Synechocystis]AGF52133.1 hypothetical protein MYO_118880 [Synechocystis sp. PCC 6803]ALJ68088.1 hypothetical protein AOY38_09705 [Synechocystis sp. PCC 6803]AVP89921.1 hypothetical protein C7I86_09735 [Synechocystis sp. IPPAS B-1465]MBD2617828.1 hypothetical protein [Synechocystis sp. FACHB-898]MBD2640459.1 hypothetical protein [Synechocystis sp. FACHB-908]
MFKPLFPLTLLLGCLSFLLTMLLHSPGQWGAVSQAQPAPPAQGVPAGGYTVVVEIIAQQVYARFPDLPKGNDYRRQSDGSPDPENTLISRMIRYHRDIQKRPTRYRFDWRLTLADYLGANDQMVPERYPGFSTLQTSPLDGDRQLIAGLNRKQRQELVDFLAELYRPQAASNGTDSGSGEQGDQNPTAPPAVTAPNQPGLSQPGDAQLLMP